MSVSTQKDPLASLYSPDQVFYAVGTLLDADDFQDEQTYHRGRLARALSYLHGAGTVVGLRVEQADAGTAEEEIRVQPGLAIDRLGRMIEVPRTVCIRLPRWLAAQDPGDLAQGFHPGPNTGMTLPPPDVPAAGIVADLFVRFVLCENGKTPAFASGPFDALDAVVPSRLREGWRLELVIRKEQPGPPPLPEDPWAGLAGIADPAARRREAHQRIFNAWREGTDQRDLDGNLVRLREHVPGQDTTSLFLARLLVPATAGNPPVRTGAPAQIDNDSRQFSYAAGALGGWIGI